jgi:hypothetical protein
VHRLTLLAALGGTLALAAAGCGSDDSSDNGNKTASDQKAQPQVKQPVEAMLPEFNKAIAAQSCQAYAPYALTFTRPAAAQPGAPAIVKDECARYKALLAHNLRNVKFTQARQFGTIALAQGPGPRLSGYTNHTAVFVLDWDGKYRFFLTNASDPQIGSSPKAGTDFAGSVNTFVKAVRDGDCAAFQRVTYPNAGPNLGVKPEAACKQVFTGKNLAPQLRADPSAKPVKLGETLDFGFYGVATKKNFYTFIVNTRPVDAGPEWKGKAKTVVVDYFPGYTPTA